MAYLNIEAFLIVDKDGNVEAGPDEESAAKRYKELDDTDDVSAIRFIQLKLKIEIPDPIVITATLPAKTGEIVMTVSG